MFLFVFIYCVLVISWELFDDNKDTFDEFTCVSIYLKIFNHFQSKNKSIQNTSYKVQNSIKNTPEGTDTADAGPSAGS